MTNISTGNIPTITKLLPEAMHINSELLTALNWWVSQSLDAKFIKLTSLSILHNIPTHSEQFSCTGIPTVALGGSQISHAFEVEQSTSSP